MVEPLYNVTIEVTIQNRFIAQLYKYQLYANLLHLALMINPDKILAVSSSCNLGTSMYIQRGFVLTKH